MSQTISTIHVTASAEQNTAISFRKPTTVGNFTEADGKAFAGNGGFLATLLDIINPLQHIPVLSNIFRAATGSTISPAANVLGGALFGGPIGLLAGIADAASTSATGKGIGGNMLAMITPAADTAKAPVQLAANIAPALPTLLPAAQALPAMAPIANESMQGNAGTDMVRQLFSAPPPGQDVIDWFHDDVPAPAKNTKAQRAYNQAQSLSALPMNP